MDDLTRLLLAAADGDRTALADFVRRVQTDVWRYCAYLVDTETADDLTQEVFIRAMRSVHRFRSDASARTWLLAIARRAAADEIRRRQRSRRAPHPTLRDEPDHADHTGLQLLIADLEEGRRAAFVLTQLLGLSYAEAATACNVPIGTIRSRVARAREDLATSYQQQIQPPAARDDQSTAS